MPTGSYEHLYGLAVAIYEAAGAKKEDPIVGKVDRCGPLFSLSEVECLYSLQVQTDLQLIFILIAVSYRHPCVTILPCDAKSREIVT